jgi:hypothetical protein
MVHIDREIGVRRVQRTRMNMTRAVAPPTVRGEGEEQIVPVRREAPVARAARRVAGDVAMRVGHL